MCGDRLVDFGLGGQTGGARGYHLDGPGHRLVIGADILVGSRASECYGGLLAGPHEIEVEAGLAVPGPRRDDRVEHVGVQHQRTAGGVLWLWDERERPRRAGEIRNRVGLTVPRVRPDDCRSLSYPHRWKVEAV